MIFSENRCPPSDQVQGHAFPDHALNGKRRCRNNQPFARFGIEQRRFCNAFALWRTCRHKQCRRQGACRGDADVCLKRGLGRVPHDLQWRVRQAIIDKSPPNIGAPERKIRQLMPGDLYGGAIDAGAKGKRP